MATLALSMVGNAVAAPPAMPTVPSSAPIITVTTPSEWIGLQDKIDLLSSNEKELVIRVSGDISFSNDIGMPWSGAPANLASSIDLHKRNVYIVGEKNSSSNSLSGIHLKGAGASLLKNVDTVYIENVDLKNCYLLAEADDSHKSAAFLAPRAKGVFLNNVTLENVGVKGVPATGGKTPVFSTAAFLVDTTSCSGTSCGALVFQDLSRAHHSAKLHSGGQTKWLVDSADSGLFLHADITVFICAESIQVIVPSTALPVALTPLPVIIATFTGFPPPGTSA